MTTTRVITQRTIGASDVLEVAEVPMPSPGPGEVLVRVLATGMNPADWKVRTGKVDFFGPPPYVLGHEFSGTVERVGAGVTRCEAGEEVYGWTTPPHGSHADHVVVAEDRVAAKPRTLDHVGSAALPISGFTAYQALITLADVRPGQRVLVHGAAGGVGHLGVQIAKARGAYVIGTASAAKHDYLRGLGVDELIDYTAEDFSTLRGIDAVLDTISNDYGPRSLVTLKPGGILVDVVGVGVDRTEVTARAAELGVRFVEFFLDPAPAVLTAFAALVDDHGVRPTIAEILPLEQAAKAHDLSETGRVRGKIVLVP
ncbi:NADP-dependent oxidoreductase [Streptomyces sp. NBC_00237]|uniref:NADP-dependent oxidoreductase n=1 Tax=Streptomyces sp. NBC_00237 TaxID=2975687 RepID=UPI00224F4982|nr:NADP-dependent oxidoreductase [Streptomyces sp. NBC_00237]MCX5205950.1 NADP-dependent oxidoreductase [Streptomyces sp. NBC_00237]